MEKTEKLPRRSPPQTAKAPSDLKERLKVGLEVKAEQKHLQDLEKDHQKTFQRNDFYREIINHIDFSLPDDESNLYGIKNALNPRLDLLYKAIRYYQTKYRDALSLDKGFPWPKWIQDRQIQKAIGKTRFQDCLDYAWNHKGPEKDSIELAKKKGIEPAKIRKRKGREFIDHWILIHFDFNAMADELSRINPINARMTNWTIQAITDATIFENMGRIGKHGKTIYKIGTWRAYPDKATVIWLPNPRPLLTKEKHFEILKNFKIKGD